MITYQGTEEVKYYNITENQTSICISDYSFSFGDRRSKNGQMLERSKRKEEKQTSRKAEDKNGSLFCVVKNKTKWRTVEETGVINIWTGVEFT